MVEFPFESKDPSSEWPEEVKQAYEHLKIPSLYDAILANEKMSLEVRRQERELKKITENIQALFSQLNLLVKIFSEEWEEYEEEEGFLQNKNFEGGQKELTDFEVELLKGQQTYFLTQEALMDMHDGMYDLSRTAKQITYQLLAILPKQDDVSLSIPAWFSIAEKMIQTLMEAIARTRYQFLNHLEKMHIELIDPQPTEIFNKLLHHALEYVIGGPSGTIAHVIRVGYQQEDQVLRLAEVTVFY